ncbi:MAG: diguanylate cyclase [Nitrospinaceae bacterium]|nr:diguanylate cyclase [Nitrospinaceae bacterium]NIR57874.1 diguanylate cyclase [Nitrospinaceae bacterium]NIS88333.1 diguanylate cyclase [Nitrospinaceae bacterium]NIT85211.1 diguanylate cyclase [Nitrospinaceae bacterium]NIU47361.1 diguanylate cyclase [Nitrospinaceae bacterium]
MQAMKAGAHDYLVKSHLSPENLSKAVRQAINFSNEEQQRIKAEKSLEAQGRLLQGVSEAATRLLTVYEHKVGVKEALGIVGKAGNLDKVFLFKDHPHPETGEGAISPKFNWTLKDEKPLSEQWTNSSYAELGLAEWIRDLGIGKTIQHVVDSGDPQFHFFHSQDIKSFVLAPIKIDYVYWGFILFADCHSFRTWTPDEVSILKTFVASIGGEIKRHNDDQAFRSIVEGTSTQTGNEFFRSLVRHLASALPARSAFISEIQEMPEAKSRIIAGWDGNRFVDDRQYEEIRSPYEDLLGGMVSFYSDQVQEAFPDEFFLREMGAQSFAGVPFFSSGMKVMGHLTVFDRRPMLDKQRTISILRVFAARAGAELERKKAEETIKTMAYYDSLTGLPNRVLLIDRLTLALAHAHRIKKRLAVMFLDFDHFKAVNDTYGHGIGDLLLKEMAQKIISIVRGEDTVARLGGDEFILILPELHDRDNAATLAEKLIQLGREPLNLDGNEIQSSFSIGVSLYPDDGRDYETLLKKADEALYSAKRKGRDGYQFAK